MLPALSEDSPFTAHWKLAPRQYVARRLATDSSPLTIDGNLEKPEWAEVEWSVPFGDIRGVADAPKEAQPTGKQQTRMKMRWDDEYLYVAAHLESDFPVHASFTKHNEPIFTEDSDFEVFVDPGGTTHAYKELEVNALNTVWNLMLNRCSPSSVGVRVRAGAGERYRGRPPLCLSSPSSRSPAPSAPPQRHPQRPPRPRCGRPYGDDGSEHSARIAKLGEQKYWEAEGVKSAVKVLKGKLNDKGGAEWTVRS